MARSRASARSGATSSQAVLREVETRGPLSARELSEGGGGRGAWWGWSDGKRALEWLFWAGLVTTARAGAASSASTISPSGSFPAAVLALPTPDERGRPARAHARIAARALGVATERDLRDYFRLDVADAKARLAELVEEGALTPVAVEGWPTPAYLAPDARAGRAGSRRGRSSRPSIRSSGSAPAPSGSSASATASRSTRRPHKREHGYYVLPFLLGDRLVARVDLKADRAGRPAPRPRRPSRALGRSRRRRAALARGTAGARRLALARRHRADRAHEARRGPRDLRPV